MRSTAMGKGANVVAELHHRFVPGEHAEIDRVEKVPSMSKMAAFRKSGSSGA
jgi:hypothetical protein